ncbi:MAG: hypothetical protein O3A84_03070 [Proteobacteria bacterium]|nr:hypothetical protein [Pseudomonadota bacterium]
MPSLGLNVLVSLLILTACQTTQTTGIPCAALDPITFSVSQDSAESVAQIRSYNAVYRELCND